MLEFIHTVHCIAISKMKDHSASSVRFLVFLKLHKEIPLIPLGIRYDEKSSEMEIEGGGGG